MPSTTPVAVHDEQNLSRRSPWRIAIFALLMVLAIFVAVPGLLVLGLRSGTSVETGATVSPADDAITFDRVAEDFADAWSAGDWAAVQSMATAGVTEVAQANHEAGMAVTVYSVDGQSVGLLVIDASDGPGLIYRGEIAIDSGRALMSALTFTGDAG